MTNTVFDPVICGDPNNRTNITQPNITDLTAKYKYIMAMPQMNESDQNTLTRKSFYESQQYENLQGWDRFFIVLYYVLAVILVLVLFISDNQFQLSMYQKGGATCVLLLYPHVINYFIGPIIWVYRFIVGFIPKNVYNSI